MPYGVKRGVKSPGEYGVMDLAGLSLAGAAGIIAALVTDYQQKGESSALYTINRWVVSAGEILGFTTIPLWMVVVGLTALGAGSIFYFQPITRQGAFAQGFGLLAVMMTAVPADLAGGLEPAGFGRTLQELDQVSHDDSKIAATTLVYTPQADTRIVEVQQRTAEAARYVVQLQIVFSNGVPRDVEGMIRRGALRGRLHNADTGETYNIFRNGDLAITGDAIVIRAGVPARSNTGTLWVRLESEGYAIEEQSAEAQLGQELNWTITLQPSSTPLWVQRLNKSYWF